MKYCVLIIDGAADWPIPERDNKTCLELAYTPYTDVMANKSVIGITQTVPDGMEASSACACMSILGYDPKIYYRGRASIEAKSMGIPLNKGEVFFRCNLVTIIDGKMESYNAGAIGDDEAHALIASLQDELGSDEVHFYPGISYRNILKIGGHTETLQATCIPPHDISGKSIVNHLPHGPGSEFLLNLMDKSRPILKNHPVNLARKERGDIPAITIWLFWGSGQSPDMPSFKQVYNISAALTSGVDLLRGLGKLTRIDVLDIPGVRDDANNDYKAQALGALKAFENYDLVIIHVEAPDEAGHEGDIEGKIDAIEKIDQYVVSQLVGWDKDNLRVLVMPDHPTPIAYKTHTAEPVPFMLWGNGIDGNGVTHFTEAEAKATGLVVDDGHKLMNKLIMR